MIEIPADDDTDRGLKEASGPRGAVAMEALMFVSWWLYRQRRYNPYLMHTSPIDGHEVYRRYYDNKPHPNDT